MLHMRARAFALVLHACLVRAFTGTEWKLTLNAGRLAGNSKSSFQTPPLAMFSPGGGRAALPSWFPPEWAADGGRLVMPLDVTFCAEIATADEPTLKRGGFTRPRALRAPSSTSFVSMQGPQEVRTDAVAWGTLEGLTTVESLLVWCVDLPGGCAKNDVSLPAGRLFFSTRVWQTEELARLTASLAAVEAEVEAELAEAQTLDGGPLALKARIKKRRANEARMERLRRGLPTVDAPTAEVPGPFGLTVALEGQMSVVRYQTKLVPWRGVASVPEYGVVGSFEMKSVK